MHARNLLSNNLLRLPIGRTQSKPSPNWNDVAQRPTATNLADPSQIHYLIIGNEAAERFSYYGMLSILMVSTTGLEFDFREAAPSMKSTIMGFWNLTVSLGNLLVMFITKILGTNSGEGSVTPGRFLVYAGQTFLVAVVLH